MATKKKSTKKNPHLEFGSREFVDTKRKRGRHTEIPKDDRGGRGHGNLKTN